MNKQIRKLLVGTTVVATLAIGGNIVKAEETKRDLVQFIVENDLANSEGVPYSLVNHLAQDKPAIASKVLEVKDALEAERVARIKAEGERLNGIKLAELERARIAEEARQAEQTRLREIEQSKVKAEQAKADEQTKLESTNGTGLRSEQPTSQPSSEGSGAISAEFTAYYPVGAGASSAEIAMQGGGITASGHDLKQSIYQNGYRVIASPPAYSFGTLLRITVGGQSFIGIVSDRGGAIQGNKFDIAVPNQSEALSFGRQQGTIEVLN